MSIVLICDFYMSAFLGRGDVGCFQFAFGIILIARIVSGYHFRQKVVN